MPRERKTQTNSKSGTKRKLSNSPHFSQNKKRKIDDDADSDDFVPDHISDDDDDFIDNAVEEDLDSLVDEAEEEEDYKDFFSKRTKGKKTTSSTPKKTLTKSVSSVSSPSTPRKGRGKKNNVIDIPTNNKKEVAVKEEKRHDWLENIRDIKKRPSTDPDYDPSTLYIPSTAFDSLTPFEIQFWKIKQNHFDTIVFFKKGKFYELYENDADVGVKEFDLKMTDRVNMRMVGIPDHCLYQWAGRFLAKGYKITLVDQAETKLAMDRRLQSLGKKKGEEKVIRREVTRILTQGTIIEEEYTADYNPSCLLSVKEIMGDDESSYGICIVDCSISKIYYMSFVDDHLHSKFETLLLRLKPREVLLEKAEYSNKTKYLIDNRLSSPVINILASNQYSSDFSFVQDSLEKYMKNSTEAVNSLIAHEKNAILISSLVAAINYLEKVKVASFVLPHIQFVDQNENDQIEREYLELDAQTLLNLEILENMNDHGKDGTLLNVVDQCITPFGKRMLRSWVYKPLFSISKINERLDAVEYLNKNPSISQAFQKSVKGIGDMERLISKMGGVHGVKVKDLINALNGFESIWKFITEDIDPIPESSNLLHSLLTLNSQGGRFPDIEQEISHFKASFNFDRAKEANTIEPIGGMDEVYDSAVAKITQIQKKLENYKDQLQKSLKIPIHFVHKQKEKFQLEIDKSALKSIQVPKDFQIVTETKAVRRYYTPFITQLLSQIPTAEEELNAVKDGILNRYLQRFNNSSEKWNKVIQSIGVLDCLISLSKVSQLTGQMCRPKFISSPPKLSTNQNQQKHFPLNDGGIYLNIENMRHPILSAHLGSEYIPNSITLGTSDHPERVVLLTGPNMGGKSTLLRQVAVLIIMAQIGCFVPASSCVLTLFDRIFTRIGASDNIFEGQSTFLIELQETSTILREASNQSLIILDELGRGTSTYDGYAIAYAALLHLSNFTKAAILFSTHYHMLTDELQVHPNISLKYMNCYVDQELLEVIYLYKMKDGVCPKSYGMNVAKVAGIHSSIIENAQIVSKQFEETQPLQKFHITTTIFKEIYDSIVNTKDEKDKATLVRLQSKIKNKLKE